MESGVPLDHAYHLLLLLLLKILTQVATGSCAPICTKSRFGGTWTFWYILDRFCFAHVLSSSPVPGIPVRNKAVIGKWLSRNTAGTGFDVWVYMVGWCTL